MAAPAQSSSELLLELSHLVPADHSDLEVVSAQLESLDSAQASLLRSLAASSAEVQSLEAEVGALNARLGATCPGGATDAAAFIARARAAEVRAPPATASAAAAQPPNRPTAQPLPRRNYPPPQLRQLETLVGSRTLLNNRAAASLLAARERINALRQRQVGLRSRGEGREGALRAARDELVAALERANALVREREGTRATLAEAGAAEAGAAASDGAAAGALAGALAGARRDAARATVAAAAGAAAGGGGGGSEGGGGGEEGPGSGDLTEAEEAAARCEIRALDARIRDA